MANNAYQNLSTRQGASNEAQPISTIADFLGTGIGSGSVLSFPPGLGGTPLADGSNNTEKTIPFTLFMPYKRKKPSNVTDLKQALYSFQRNPLDTLPSPEFAIALPTTSDSLKTGYTVNYEQADVGQALGGLINAKSADFAKIGGAAFLAAAAGYYVTRNSKAATLLGIAGGAVASANTSTGEQAKYAIQQSIVEQVFKGNKETVSLVLGEQANPFTEYVYKNVAPRTHSFSYVFMPRTKNESEIVDKIINVFKYAMLPKMQSDADNKNFFEFPYEFQIVHSLDHTTFSVLPSVLQKCDVDYGSGTESPKFFTSDYPAKISMSLQFQEVILLTRDDVIRIPEGSSDKPDPSKKLRFRF